MTPDVTIKQNDTKIRFNYTPKINGQFIPPEDVAEAQLSFLLRNADSSLRLKKAAQYQTVVGQDYVEFFYDPEPSDVSTPGKFRQEWELITIDGKPLTFPNNGYNIVEILPDLG